MNGYIDLHTHILPGVDDGAMGMAEGLAMVRLAYENGTRTLFLTPHDRGGLKQADIRQAFCCFRETVERELPGMELYLGSEIGYELDTPSAVEGKRVLSLDGSRYCLVEFHPAALRSQVEAGVWEMVRFGYVPVIAHPERNRAFRVDQSLADEVLEMGALLQLNADSIMGKRGLRTALFCHRLLKERKVHFVASDAHNPKNRPPRLGECWKAVCRLYGKEYACQLFRDNARRIFANE